MQRRTPYGRKLFGTLALILVAGVAACDGGDTIDATARGGEAPVMPQQAMDPAVMATIAEIQEIQQRLEPIQREALQDEALASQLADIQSRVETAMREEDAELFGRIDRLQAQVAAAEEAGDQEGMQALMIQAQAIQQDVQALQAAVIERPEIREPVAEFEVAHRARMIQIDPEAEPLLDRMDELVASLP